MDRKWKTKLLFMVNVELGVEHKFPEEMTTKPGFLEFAINALSMQHAISEATDYLSAKGAVEIKNIVAKRIVRVESVI